MSEPARSSDRRPSPRALGVWLLGPGGIAALLVIVAVGLDAYRVQFFADDFHFLDVARRFPIGRLLSGAHGMWPWYRPLSREVFFECVDAAGPHRLLAAHSLGLLVLLGTVGLLWRAGCRLVGPTATAIAIPLFVTFEHTKFLTAWASGFQDLLSTFLLVLAVDAHQRGRRGWAAAAVLLAPLAKETGFAALPLLLASDAILERRVMRAPELLRYGGAATLAAIAHVAARLSWSPTGATFRTAIHPERLSTIFEEALRGFLSPAPTASPGPLSVAAALAAAALTAALVLAATSGTRSTVDARADGDAARGTGFALAAAMLGALPVIAGHLLRITSANAYHLYPAVPWASLLLGWGIVRLPPLTWRTAIPLLVAWNVWATGFSALDMDRRENWGFERWGWRQAVRMSAQSARLSADLRREVPARPESLVILYDGVPAGAFFQTEDGPAARVALDDRTVRAFGIAEAPADVREDWLAILGFNTNRLHLRCVDWSDSETLLRAMKAVIAGRADPALALLAYRASSDPDRFDRAYLRAAARLVRDGPPGFLDGLAAAGLDDTAGATPRALTTAVSRFDPMLGAGMERMLRNPTAATSHAALADSLLVRGVLPGAGVELRIAATLDPDRAPDRYRLALVMLRLGGAREARAELETLVREYGPDPLAAAAREALDRMPPEPDPGD